MGQRAPTEEVSHVEYVRRDRDRRRPQRPGVRGVSGPLRRQDLGAGIARRAWRCGHHRGAVGGRPASARHPAVVRDEPHAADDRAGTQPGAARVQGASDGAVVPGVSRGRLADHLRGRSQAHPRAAGQVLQEGRGRVAGVPRLDRGHRRGDGPAAHPGASEHRLASGRRICSTWPSWPGRCAAASLHASPRTSRGC